MLSGCFLIRIPEKLTLKKLKESSKEVVWISLLSPSVESVLLSTVFFPALLA